MDANPHKLHTIGVADNAGDVPVSVRANVANAEASAVIQQLLGLRMIDLALSQDRLLQRIEERMFSIVQETRASISRADLHTALDTNLTNALQQIRPGLDYDHATQRERVQAVARAAYESIPVDLMNQMSVLSAPVHCTIENGQPSSIVDIPSIMINGAAEHLRIDVNHPFWKSNTFRSQSDLQRAMAGLTGRDVGLLNPNLRAHSFTTNEIRRITNASFDVISVPSVNIADTLPLAVRIGPAGPTGSDLNISVRMNLLLKGATTDDAPRGLQNRNIAELNTAQIRTLLLHRGAAGNFPYWRLFVNAGNHLPTDRVTQCIARPFLIGFDLSGVVESEMISAGVPAAGRTGSRSIRLLDAHTDIRAEQAKLQTLMDRLATGSENSGGAALALSLAASDRNVMAAATQQTEVTRLQTDLNRVRARLELSAQLKKLSELKLNLRIPLMPGGGAANYDLIARERQALNIDIGGIGSAAGWTSQFCIHGGFALPNTFISPSDRRDMASRLQPQLKELAEEQGRYEELADVLQRIQHAAVGCELYGSATLLAAFVSNAGVVNRPGFTANMNNLEIAETIRNQTQLQSDAEIEADIKRNEDLLKKARSGGENGDTLQQKIFDEHFKRQGLSEAEAKKSANYMYARSFVDHELNGQIRALEEDLFEEHPETGFRGIAERHRERRPTRVLYDFTRAVGLPRRNVGSRNNVYDWQSLSYPKLVTSYFGLKKLYEGGGPAYINCAGSPLIKRNMRDIARTLAERHVPMLLNDLGNDLSDADRAKLQSRKTLSLETLEQFLTGDAPEKYKTRIDHVLHHTDHRTDWKRRGVMKGVGYTANSLKLAAGYTGASVGKAASYTKNSVVAAKDSIVRNRKNIATFALFTALGGPMGMAAWGIYKSLDSGSPKTTSAH